MKQTIVRLCQIICVVAVIASATISVVIATESSPRAALAAAGRTVGAGNGSNNKTTSQAITTLQSQIDAIIAKYSNLEVSAVVMDAPSGVYSSSGEAVSFKAASITKVISAAAYMHQVEEGSASLDTVIQGSTAQSLLQRMLTNSDNAAWAAINDYLGKDAIQRYGASIGLSSYDAYNNTINAKDQATVLSKLATHQLLKASHTSLLEAFMQHTNNDDLIPAAIPTAATVYHKYGYLDGYLHDSAIIAYSGKTYALVILTKNSTGTLDDYGARLSLFHDITATVTTAMERS